MNEHADFSRCGGFSTMYDLRVLSMRSPLVRAFLTAWEAGHSPSLEATLISMACALVDANARLTELAVQRLVENPSIQLVPSA